MNRPTNDKKASLKVLMLGPDLKQMGGIATVENLILAHIPSEVEIRHISTHDYGSAGFRIKLFGRALWQTIQTLSCDDVDVVHISFSQRGSAWRKAVLTLIARAYSKPVILHAHSSQFHIFFDNLSGVGQSLLRWAYQKCAHFIALSESWKKYYMSSLGLDDFQVVVLSNSVQLPPQIPDRSSSDKVTFLFLGRIGQRKGAFDLIQAFAALPEPAKSQSHLFIAGDGDVEQARELVNQLGLTEQIIILDWLNPEQRDAYLAKVDAFVLPSYNEGLPLALLEAMGWGLASITTPVGGIPELITHNKDGLLVEPGNVQQLSEALRSLIEDKNLRLTLGANARSRVEPLSIHNYCSSLIALYRSALNPE